MADSSSGRGAWPRTTATTGASRRGCVPWYTLIPPRAGHPIGGHAWVPIDDETCWAWSVNYLPHQAIPREQVLAMKAGRGIHVRYIPGTFIPLANQSNDYLIDREAQAAGLSFSGVDGIAMQDASLQESMGPIADRTRENLVTTDNGVIFSRRLLLRLARANREGKPHSAAEGRGAAHPLVLDRARQDGVLHRGRAARALPRARHRAGHGVTAVPHRRIAISLGEPAGIGPEIALKAAACGSRL